MRLVAIESPYAARAPFTVDDHVKYARLAMRHSLGLGEAPFLSHLLYTQVLDDSDGKDRIQGFGAGLAWAARAASRVVYYDLGISPGMDSAIKFYRKRGLRMELRRIFPPNWGQALRAGIIDLDNAIAMHAKATT